MNIGPVGTVLANDPRALGSIQGHVYSKDFNNGT